MSVAFDTFGRSATSAFKRSALKARGYAGSEVIELLYTVGSNQTEIDRAATAWITGRSTESYLYTNYECLTLGGPFSATSVTKFSGSLECAALDLPSGDPTQRDTLYVDDNRGAYHQFGNGVSSNHVLAPSGDASLGLNENLPRDTEDAALWAVSDCNYVRPSRRQGVPGCGASWNPSTPPSNLTVQDATVYGTGLDNHYFIASRPNASSAWTRAALPYRKTGLSEPIQISQHTGQLVTKASSTTIESWPIGTAYDSATPTVYTVGGGATVSKNFALWGDYLVTWRSDLEIEVFDLTDGSSFGTLGSPYVAGSNGFDAAHGWLVVKHNDDSTVQFWELPDDGSGPSYDSAVADISFWTIGMINSTTALWQDPDYTAARRQGGAWVKGSSVTAVKDHAATGAAFLDWCKDYAFMGAGSDYTYPVLVRVE